MAWRPRSASISWTISFWISFWSPFFWPPPKRLPSEAPTGIGPLLTSLPVGIDLLAKLAASGNLLLSHGRLLSVEKPRARLATHCLGQSLVRTVASLGIAGASAARL